MKKKVETKKAVKAYQRIINNIKYVVSGDESVVRLSDKEFIRVSKQQKLKGGIVK